MYYPAYRSPVVDYRAIGKTGTHPRIQTSVSGWRQFKAIGTLALVATFGIETSTILASLWIVAFINIRAIASIFIQGVAFITNTSKNTIGVFA